MWTNVMVFENDCGRVILITTEWTRRGCGQRYKRTCSDLHADFHPRAHFYFKGELSSPELVEMWVNAALDGAL